MADIPKPAQTTEFIARCYEDEKPILVALRDDLEKARLIRAADAVDGGFWLITMMTSRTRELRDLITDRWDLLVTKQSMAAEV